MVMVRFLFSNVKTHNNYCFTSNLVTFLFSKLLILAGNLVWHVKVKDQNYCLIRMQLKGDNMSFKQHSMFCVLLQIQTQ